jgi:hypothetical protein
MSNTSEVVKTEAMKMLKELFENKEFKHDLVKAINDDVNIPMIGEKTERKVFNSLYSILAKETIEALEKTI